MEAGGSGQDTSTSRTNQKPEGSSLVSWWISKYLTHTDRPSHREEQFQSYYGELSLSMSQALYWTIFVLVLVTWPTDFLFYESSNVIYSLLICRIGVLLVVPIYLIGVKELEWFREWAQPMYIVLTCLILIVSGYQLGKLHSLEFLFSYALIVPMAGAFLSLGIMKRLIVTLIFGLSYAISFIYASTYLLAGPYFIPRILIVASVAFLAALGSHLYYHVIREYYFEILAEKGDEPSVGRSTN